MFCDSVAYMDVTCRYSLPVTERERWALQVLLEYGGIYLDLDVLITRPFDELRRQYPCTIGREQETKACGSVIVCSRHSPFLLLWINSYIDDYRIEEWAYNTGQVPN